MAWHGGSDKARNEWSKTPSLSLSPGLLSTLIKRLKGDLWWESNKGARHLNSGQTPNFYLPWNWFGRCRCNRPPHIMLAQTQLRELHGNNYVTRIALRTPLQGISPLICVENGVEIKSHCYIHSLGANIVDPKCPLTIPSKETLIRNSNMCLQDFQIVYVMLLKTGFGTLQVHFNKWGG